MGLRTLLFAALFILCAGGATFMPLLGLLGYIAHYVIGPEGQWWAAPLRPFGIRYSFTLAAMAGLGIALNFRKLRYGAAFLSFQEKLILCFLGLMWLLRAFSEPTEWYTVVDHPTVKLTKVVVFCLMLTHVVTQVKSLKILVWTLVISTFILGLQAYNAPRWTFAYGRLEGVGGVDFNEANFLPAFIGGVLPLMGILFLESRWPGKLLVLLAGVFSVNAIVLTRSRGAILGIGLGAVVALLLAPKQYRMKIMAGLLVAAAGGLYLSDPGFLARVGTINRSTDEMDGSQQGRLETWQFSLKMIGDHPEGIGPGNFFQFAGRYDARYQGRDAHNTYLRCGAELGIAGFLLFLGLIIHAILVTKRTMQKAYNLPLPQRNHILMPSYGFAVGLCAMLGCGLTVTLLYTEALWWFLMMPVCLERAVDNLIADFHSHSSVLPEEEPDHPVLASC